MDGGKVFLSDEAKGEPVLEENFQRVIYSIYIGNKDGRAVLRSFVDAVVAEGVGQFFHRAYAAGKDDEGIARFNQFLLSGNHVRYFQKLRNTPVGLFLLDEYPGDNAGDPAAGGHGGICRKAHESHGAAAVNHVEASLPQRFSQPRCQGSKGTIISKVGTAVDSNILVSGHGFSFFLHKSQGIELLFIVS